MLCGKALEFQQFKGLITLRLCVMTPTTTPSKSILTENRSNSHLPTASVASSGDCIDSIRIQGILRLLALLTITAVEPFHRRKISPRLSHKSQMRVLRKGRRCQSVTTTINGSDAVINSILSDHKSISSPQCDAEWNPLTDCLDDSLINKHWQSPSRNNAIRRQEHCITQKSENANLCQRQTCPE